MTKQNALGDETHNYHDDWIGQVPDTWKVQPLRAMFYFRNEKNDPIQTDQILSLSIADGVTLYSDEGRGGNKRKDDLTAYKLAHPGDIVLNSMNVIVGAVGRSDYFGAISPVYYALKNKSDSVSSEYYARVFQNHAFLRGLLRYGKGILIKKSDSGKLNTIRMKISQDDLKVIPLPAPPLKTQHRIVNFLDEKTAEIDAAIAKKQRLIELLNEQKAILINRAVTRGLNRDVPMKDSGVDWIGEIPAHWEVKQLKRCIREAEYGLSESTSDTGKFRCLGMGHIVDGEITEAAAGYLHQVDRSMFLQKGDILFNRTNSFDLVGKSGIYTRQPEQPETFASYLVRLRCTADANPSWLSNVMQDSGFLSLIRSQALRSLNQANLNPSRLMRNHIPVPPFEEQCEITRYLTSLSTNFKVIAGKTRMEISALGELKQTLIANAVTGKIKV